MQDLTGKDIGRYHILEKLGQGGMAIVYKAYDTRLERDVALKIIRIEEFPPSALERVLKRFEREAKSLAKMEHRNIINVFDFGEYEGAPYLVMEYLPGGTLREQTGKPWDYQEAARLLLPVARALAYAHESGLIHRDVKPANILITRAGEPLLSDFGIAKILETDQASQLTGTGMGIGTPEYMAPEQGLGKAVDHRADVYALGVVLYELLTGRKPFTADTPMAVLLKQIHDPLPDPRRYVSELPEQAERVLIKALAKEPENRYESMAVFTQALERLIANETPQRGAATTGLPPVAGALDSVVSTVQALLEMARELEKSGSQKAALDTCRRALAICPPDSPQAQQIKTMIARLAGMENVARPLGEQAGNLSAALRQEMPTRDDLDSAAGPVHQSQAQRVDRERKKPKSFAAFLRSIPRWAWLAGGWVIIVMLSGLMLGQGANGKGPLAMLASATVTNTPTATDHTQATTLVVVLATDETQALQLMLTESLTPSAKASKTEWPLILNTQNPTSIVKITLDCDIREFTQAFQDNFIKELAKLLGIEPELINVLRIEAGTGSGVFLTFKMPVDAIQNLIAMDAKSDWSLDELHVIDVLDSEDPEEDTPPHVTNTPFAPHRPSNPPTPTIELPPLE